MPQPVEHSPADVVEHHRQVVHDQQHPSSARGVRDHERAGSQPQVDPVTALPGLAVPEHAGVRRFAGDVRDPATTQEHQRAT